MRILKFFAFNKFSEKALSKSVKAQGDFIEYTPFFLNSSCTLTVVL